MSKTTMRVATRAHRGWDSVEVPVTVGDWVRVRKDGERVRVTGLTESTTEPGVALQVQIALPANGYRMRPTKRWVSGFALILGKALAAYNRRAALEDKRSGLRHAKAEAIAKRLGVTTSDVDVRLGGYVKVTLDRRALARVLLGSLGVDPRVHEANAHLYKILKEGF